MLQAYGPQAPAREERLPASSEDHTLEELGKRFIPLNKNVAWIRGYLDEAKTGPSGVGLRVPPRLVSGLLPGIRTFMLESDPALGGNPIRFVREPISEACVWSCAALCQW